MKIYCPVCNYEDGFEIIEKNTTIVVRGEPTKVNISYHKCGKCGEEFLVNDLDDDPLAKAFAAYREKHKLLKPNEIRQFREGYSLTQAEFAKLLGLGVATISRYESGKLQEESHDTLIKLAMDSECFRNIVSNSEGVLNEKKKQRILEQDSDQIADNFKRFITINFESKEVDEFNGFRLFDFGKFSNATLFFCKEGVVKTKLNKLMFYADFLHFKDYVLSITGAKYAHVPFGPAPTNYDLYFPLMIRQGLLAVEEIDYGGYLGEKYTSLINPDLNIFSEGELRVLSIVKEFFRGYKANEISEYSHVEKGYQETSNGKMISYRYADDMKIPVITGIKLPKIDASSVESKTRSIDDG